jgi:hypothetical protein
MTENLKKEMREEFKEEINNVNRRLNVNIHNQSMLLNANNNNIKTGYVLRVDETGEILEHVGDFVNFDFPSGKVVFSSKRNSCITVCKDLCELVEVNRWHKDKYHYVHHYR